MLGSPDVLYSGYTTEPEQKERCCENCKYYIPTDALRGRCYEFEVLPYAGCSFFEEKNL